MSKRRDDKKARERANQDFLKTVDSVVNADYQSPDEYGKAILNGIGPIKASTETIEAIHNRTANYQEVVKGIARDRNADPQVVNRGLARLQRKLIEIREAQEQADSAIANAEKLNNGDPSRLNAIERQLDNSKAKLDELHKLTAEGWNIAQQELGVKRLYHYTSTSHWPQIQSSGFIKLGDDMTHSKPSAPDVVILTDIPNLSPKLAGWADGSFVDKTKVRIEVVVKDAEPWLNYARERGAADDWIDRLTRSSGADTPDHWWVVGRPIFSSEWTEVRIDDIPVSKSPIQQARPVWLTSHGAAAKCDFCYEADGTAPGASYRYHCKVFEIDGWSNGSVEHPEEADWGACWVCAKLIESKDVANLLARTRANSGQFDRSNPGSKAGTEDGVWDPDTVTKRVLAFMECRTGTRVFIGMCDVCSTRGETVRWLYPVNNYAYTAPVLISGRWIKKTINSSDGVWTVCETCGKLVERRNLNGLIERCVERQRIRMEEDDGVVLNPSERRQLRSMTTGWITLFIKNINGPRTLIPDLPKPPKALQVAPIAAQAALEAKLTLYRWLRTYDGRTYVGSWFDRMRTGVKGRSEREADTGEIFPFATPLRYGEAFYLEQHIATSIHQAADELLESDVPWILTPEHLPATSGFFYSDRPFGKSADHPMRGLGWCLVSAVRDVGSDFEVEFFPNGMGDPSKANGVAITTWSERPGDRTLRPSAHILWQFGKDFRNIKDLDAVTPSDDLGNQAEAAFACLLAFIQQRIVIAGAPMAVSSSVRKHIERDAPEHTPAVRVITLRRVQRMDYKPPEEPSGRHLTVQFMVRGFWRNQCYSPHLHKEFEESGVGCKDHQGKYVPKHWRGPEDAPIKQPRMGEVFDLAR